MTIDPVFVRLACTDAISLLESLPPRSVDAVITDPPYSSGGAMRTDRAKSTIKKYVSTGSNIAGRLEEAGADFEGDNAGERAQERRIAWWADRAHRAVRPGGYVGFWCDWRTLPLAIDGLQMGGIVFRGVGPWIKTMHRPMKGGMGAGAEYLVWGTRGPIRDAEARACVRGFVQAVPVRGEARVHPTQKPVEVVAWSLGFLLPGEVVVDPFAGSGTTAVAAALAGVHAIVGDTDPRWIETARARLDAEAPGRWLDGG